MKRKILVSGVLLAQVSFAKAGAAVNSAEVIPVAIPDGCATCYLDGMQRGDRSLVELNPVELSLQLAQATPSLEFLSDALEVANTIADPQAKARVLSQIALKYAEIGQTERAEEILLQALAVANTLEDNAAQARILSEIAIARVEIGDEDAATGILSQAADIANEISDSAQKAGVLTELALAYDRLGVSAISAQLLEESQALAIAAEVPETPTLFPLEPTGWNGNVGIAASLSSGAVTTSIATLFAGIDRQWARQEWDAGISLSNNFDDSRVEPLDENQFQGQFDTEYRYHITARYQYFASSQVQRDELNNIDLRTNFFTGPGLNLWRGGPDQTLDMQLGLGVRYENSDIESDDFDFPVAQYRLRYKDIYFDVLNLTQFLTVETPLDDVEDYYIESTTTFGIPIIQGWSFNNSLLLRYAANPILDNPNLRVDVITGIQYDF
ncbi:DUF481 domain-containing protein [Phormidium sp. CCY1219]|uniref:DUF481 domain-containing protein n=1 Tax=Phormidium sp. CCY1219 TaxID=2886104 RepID=UPI002D1F8878|nr:DUF481 domain-containing protein [Phormidium sp. CCY1219]MEB3827147.1 DUF481 domain-containing protein [Phormidium sp. CCY1219]